MKRRAFKMKVKPGFEAEYKRRHDEIWPEMKEQIARKGVSDYSIFLDRETGTLFAVQKLTDDSTVGKAPASPLVRRWWAYMADIMEYNPDGTPVQIPLEEVFHID
jgi:L-rhamnose mutarotase